MNKTKMLTTAAFAKMCNTTKQTLLYYDKMGLLKPKYVSDNGYRYYGAEQLFTYDMIVSFKETGSSLKEIKRYLTDLSFDSFLKLLEEKREVLREERKRLVQRETMLEDMVLYTREALHFPYDTVILEAQDEERLEIFSTGKEQACSLPEFAEQLAEYIAYYNKRGRRPRHPYGAIVKHNDVLAGKYREECFFSRAVRSTTRNLLHIKPAGTYAVLGHKGTLQSHMDAYQCLLAHIKRNGLTICGDVYAYDMMGYVLWKQGKNYAGKYCVRVVQGCNAL